MAESRLVPTNMMAWPRVRDLLPDQKLIVYHLWATCHPASGCQLLDLGGFQGALNITAPAIQEALAEFQRRGLVALDDTTGEVAIIDWFRFHKFEAPSRRRLLEDSIHRIQSPRLRSIVEESMTYVLRKGKVREGKETTPPVPPRKRGGVKPAGAGRGDGKKEGKEKPSNQNLPPEIEQMVQDELQGRQEASARGEAPPISNISAWLASVRLRAASGEEITTDHGQRVLARREAEARHQIVKGAPLQIDPQSVAKGAALLARARRHEADT